MANYVRMIAIGGTIGVLTAGSLALAPAVIAAVNEKPVETVVAGTIQELFPPEAINPKIFRKYDIVLGDGVSTDVQRSQTVRKIGYGYSRNVTIVTTPSGTYSSDGLLSPNVRYPGIEVTAKRGWRYWPEQHAGHWVSYSRGSIIFFYFTGGPADRT
jgi:hypothetical protein